MEDFSTIFERAMLAETKREHKVFARDMRHECEIDCTAHSVMEIVEEHVSPALYEDMMDFG